MSCKRTAVTGAAEQAPAERQIDRSPAAVERYDAILALIDKNTRPDTIFSKLPWCTGRMIEDAKAYRTQKEEAPARAPLLVPPPQTPVPKASVGTPAQKPAAPAASKSKDALRPVPKKVHMRREDRNLLHKLQSRIDNPLPAEVPLPVPVVVPAIAEEETSADVKKREAQSMIELVVYNAKKCFKTADAELRAEKLNFHTRPYVFAILLVLNYMKIAPEQAASALCMEAAAAQSYFQLAKEEVVGKTSVNHYTQILCQQMGIAFVHLRNKL